MNRPGLPGISYRIGTQSVFFQRMLAALPVGLTARSLDDPAVALADAAAVVADVLTFYQERIANEGYLRTATERRSVLELARAIGYELGPGVAASTYLAFTVEDAPGAPGEADIPIGTQVKAIPITFETVEAIHARAEWNALKPLLEQPQKLTLANPRQILLQAPDPTIKPGDLLLVALPAGTATYSVLRVNEARVYLSEQAFTPPSYQQALRPDATPVKIKLSFTETNIKRYVLRRRWREADLQSFLTFQGWDADELLKHINRPPAEEPLSNYTGVFRFRSRLGFFGNNAPAYASLPKPSAVMMEARSIAIDPIQIKVKVDPNDWDAGGGRDIWTDGGASDVYLERAVSTVVPNSWAVFQMAGLATSAFRVSAVEETSLAEYALSGRSTGLKLVNPSTGIHYKIRRTTAFVESEPLPLANLPIEDLVAAGSKSLLLGRMVLGLKAGQRLALTGESSDTPGVGQAEIVLLDDITHQDGLTTLHFRDPLEHSYVRSSVVLNANVALATHGETVNELLGGGDGSQPNQRFTLKKPPLTYVSAPTPSGAESTLAVRVNDVLWQESPSLYGVTPDAHAYTVRIADDTSATVIFGDGRSGARPPTGAVNISATYRSGTGPEGEVDTGKLTLLQTRPHGVRSVRNPLAATGAAPPETLDSARGNAPRTVRTLDRIVSLDDFADFARGFAGIAKARAVAYWSGERRIVRLVVATESGASLEVTSTLYDNLRKGIDAARDPVQQVEILSFQPKPFSVDATVVVDPAYIPEKVLAAVTTALLAAFAYQQRDIGQPVTAAEVTTTIQRVEGVIAGEVASPPAILPAGGTEVLYLEPTGIRVRGKTP